MMLCAQAVMVKHLCLQILQQHLCVSNCFSILQTAMQTGISCLLRSSLDLACSSFSAALAENYSGWAALSKEGVLLVLQNSGLQVTHASEAFCLHLKWLDQQHCLKRTLPAWRNTCPFGGTPLEHLVQMPCFVISQAVHSTCNMHWSV